MSEHEHDPTSVGAILYAMGLVNDDQLQEATSLQEKADVDILLGSILVANGVVSREQLNKALEMQEGLRSKKKHKRAVAQANLGLASSDTVIRVAERVRRRSADVRKRTGEDHAAVASHKMMAASGDNTEH